MAVTILIVYVNDIVIIRNDMVEVERLKKYLCSALEIKDLGELR